MAATSRIDARARAKPSSKELLVRTAERLFALHGIDGVSLRQIGAEAGMANNSAVQYHFGTKERLVEAIFLFRLPTLTQRREILAAQVPEGDLRAALEAHLLPVMEQAERDDSCYLRFLEQLMRYGAGVHPFEQLAAEHRASHDDYVRRVSAMLPDLPPVVRTMRVNQVSAICLHASADRERAHEHGAGPQPPFALHASALLDGLVGFVRAPVSPDTLVAAESAPKRFRPRIPAP